MRSPGEQFGPYELLRQIAVGGMAEIYLARSIGAEGFEKYVALKMIHPNFSQDRHFVQMLVEEAKISVYLNHVNIAHVFDLGRIGDTYYIAMEYVDGADLYHIMRRITQLGMSMPFHVAAYIAHEVCAGLDYAHRCRDQLGRPLKIVHRDMSPQNVLVSKAGEVKVADFGIAKAALRVQQTAVGVIKGKYYYMSPEQAWGKPLDHRTDIFSAGVVLYEVIAGQMLYLEEDVAKLLDMVRRADVPPLHTKRPDVPRELEDIVMKAVASNPDDRWQSALEFGQALEEYLVRGSAGLPVAELQQIVAAALDEVEETTSVERPDSIESRSLMSRKDFVPLVDHSVLFSSESEYSVTDHPSPFLLDAEDEFAEATVISGPPAFDDLSRRFVSDDPSLPITVNPVSSGGQEASFDDEDEESTVSLKFKGRVTGGSTPDRQMEGEDAWEDEDAPTRVRQHVTPAPAPPPAGRGGDESRDWLDALPTPPPPPPPVSSPVAVVPSSWPPGGPVGWPGAVPGAPVHSAEPFPSGGPIGGPAAMVTPPPPAWWPGHTFRADDDVLDPEEQAALAPSKKLRVLAGAVMVFLLLGGIVLALYLFVPALMAKKPGKVEILTEPSGAIVEVDGKSMPKQTPVLIDGLDPDKSHLVVLKKEGYRPERIRVWVESGDKLVKRVVLSPIFKTSGGEKSP